MSKLEAAAKALDDARLKRLLIQDSDFDNYMNDRDNSEHANVKSAKVFEEDLIDYFNNGSTLTGDTMGWDKTVDEFRYKPNEVTVFAGFNGSGKSLVLGQIFLHLMKTRKVLICSFEMMPRTTLSRMCRQALGSDMPTDDFIRKFCDRAQDKLFLYDHVGTITPERVYSVLYYSAEVLGVTHVMIDSMMKCGVPEEDYPAQKEFINKLTSIARDTGLHIHLVAHSKKFDDEFQAPNKMSIAGSASITNMVDNVIICWRNKKKYATPNIPLTDEEKNIPDCMLLVEKQRNGECEPKYSFWFDNKSLRWKESRF